MEQLMTNLVEALKEVETKHPDSKAQKILERAVGQAELLKSKWKTSWGLIN